MHDASKAIATAPSFVDADCLNKTGSVSKAKENTANQQKKINTQEKENNKNIK